MTVQTAKKSTARCSIMYADGVSLQEARNEMCNLMSVEDREGEKAKMKVIIPTGDETLTLRSPPDVMTANMIRYICERNWKPVVNAMFGYEKLREELLSSLSRNMAREMTEYIQSDSMLKYSSPDELAAFSNRKLVHEIKVFCPLWHACISGAANVHQPDSKLDGSINSIALATSAIARLRNSHNSAHAKRVSTVLVHSGAKVNDFTRLNHLGLCTSPKQVITDQVDASQSHDSTVLVWKPSIEERNGALSLIQEILGEQMPETLHNDINLSKAALERMIYFSELAFERLMSLVVSDRCSKAELENAKRELLKEDPVSYR